MSFLKVEVEPRKVHGKTLYYPANHNAELFLKMLRRQSAFTDQDLIAMRKLNVMIDFVQPTFEFPEE